MTFTDALLVAGLTAIVNAAVIYGTVKTQLAQIKRSVNAAHRRLDRIGAPSSGEDSLA